MKFNYKNNVKLKITKNIVLIIILTIFILLFIYNIYDMNKRNIVSILNLPFTEEQIIKKEIKIHTNNSIVLLIVAEHIIEIKETSILDLTLYKGTRLYNELYTIISDNDMCIEETIVGIYHVEHKIRKFFFYRIVVQGTVYFFTKDNKYTFIYTYIPKIVNLPREYKI